MNTLLKTGTVGLAGLVVAGLVAWPATSASAKDDQVAAKRDDDTQVVVTTVDDDDDGDDTGLKGTNTNTRTNTNGATNTRTGTNSGHDNSRSGSVRDLTSDGPGRGNVDHSRNDTNDRTRHNTRG
ncbi:hypothetical protein [Nocardioides sp. SR21]|uniref:hypothetical protein n=1 Tax=Nocardioides sp. SR21 TaxID=2919501 RepID=UPI001FAADE95|nr:hypothetical protein [Nocardioides sp. SR21]